MEPHEVSGLRGLTLLEFGTSWCGHCKVAQAPIAAALQTLTQPLQHIKIEDGPGQPLGRSFRVKLWPTLILLRDGAELARVVRPTRVEDLAPLWVGLGESQSPI